jgi:retron-type reverse transcriptase
MLDVLDKELEKRGHGFVRYADDCNIYVSKRLRLITERRMHARTYGGVGGRSRSGSPYPIR